MMMCDDYVDVYVVVRVFVRVLKCVMWCMVKVLCVFVLWCGVLMFMDVEDDLVWFFVVYCVLVMYVMMLGLGFWIWFMV